MGVESEALGNAASKHRIDFNGQTYEAGLIDGKVKSAFEKRLFERAKKMAESTQKELGREWYINKLEELNEQFILGDFDLMSQRGLEYMKKIQGSQFLLSLLIGCSEDVLTNLVIAKPDEVKALLSLVIKESFPGVDFDALSEKDRLRKEEKEKQAFSSSLHAPITAQELLETQGPK